MNRKAGIWIDHKEATIVSVAKDGVTTKTLKSEVGGHTRYSDRDSQAPGEKKFEERHTQDLNRYYNEVIRELGDPEAIFILGPGEAKLELKERLSHTMGLDGRTVSLETSDKLTEPQIIAKVKEHYAVGH